VAKWRQEREEELAEIDAALRLVISEEELPQVVEHYAHHREELGKTWRQLVSLGNWAEESAKQLMEMGPTITIATDAIKGNVEAARQALVQARRNVIALGDVQEKKLKREEEADLDVLVAENRHARVTIATIRAKYTEEARLEKERKKREAEARRAANNGKLEQQRKKAAELAAALQETQAEIRRLETEAQQVADKGKVADIVVDEIQEEVAPETHARRQRTEDAERRQKEAEEKRPQAIAAAQPAVRVRTPPPRSPRAGHSNAPPQPSPQVMEARNVMRVLRESMSRISTTLGYGEGDPEAARVHSVGSEQSAERARIAHLEDDDSS